MEDQLFVRAILASIEQQVQNDSTTCYTILRILANVNAGSVTSAAHKAPFIAVVETEGEEHRPQRMQLRTVSGFRSAEIERYAKTSLEVGSIVVSDGLACFKAVEKAGCHHIPFVSEGGRKGVELIRVAYYQLQ